MKNVWILTAVFALLAALGWIERRQHRRRLDRIRIRIHVNGTRGKSSVTRLIAAGSARGGHRHLRQDDRHPGAIDSARRAGTTDRARLPAERFGTDRRRARGGGAGAEALVVECMALTPSLQWLSEWQLIRATHAVITGAREDHLDVMGPTERDVAWALAGMIPPGGTLFTADAAPRRRLSPCGRTIAAAGW